MGTVLLVALKSEKPEGTLVEMRSPRGMFYPAAEINYAGAG